jgi:hypothetical protein
VPPSIHGRKLCRLLRSVGMASALFRSEMTSDDVARISPSPSPRSRHCRHCSAKAVDPPLLTISAVNVHDWFLCEACWLLLEIGFSDARPFDDLYEYLSPIDGRLGDADVYHHILRGRVLLERRGGLVRRGETPPREHIDP